MSRSSSEAQVSLTVRAADSLTEIFLVNSRFQRLAAGIGQLEVQIAPGIYKVRFRAGQSQIDRFVEVKAEAAAQIVEEPAVEFATPVPMPCTLSRRQAHEEAARDLSRAAGLNKGSGSNIFFFCRGLSEEASRPWLGVSLHDLHGRLLAKAEQGTCDHQNRFCALNLEVNPGTYILRVEEEPGEIYEMFVIALAGWQTQIFALAETAWQPGIDACRAALPTATVLMAEQGKGFDPNDAGLRQAELIRLSLLNSRKVLTETAAQGLLAAQGLNPMAAILAAHLLLRQNPEHCSLAAELVRHLGEVFSSHPDVQAVLLDSGAAESPSVFALPPMLRASWQRLLRAKEQGKAAVPSGSLNDQIAAGMLKTSLWLIRRLNAHHQ